MPHYALVAEPLREPTQKNTKSSWGVKQQEAFGKLKGMITELQTLAYFKNDCRTRIAADAGTHALRAIVTQQHDGEWRVVSYMLRSLMEVGKHNSETEKEALSLVWAYECFNIYANARKFELDTDHKLLECNHQHGSSNGCFICKIMIIRSYIAPGRLTFLMRWVGWIAICRTLVATR